MSDTRLEDFLAAVTDALLADEDAERDVEQLMKRHALPAHDAEALELARLIKRLRAALVRVQPSPYFVRTLKHDLIGTPQADPLLRWRRLPARVQLAALAALFGGFALLLNHRLGLHAPRDEEQRLSLES
ncbi:MAG: hypothetical protein NZ750_14030 [Anaerolineae bacterium]|nr:hypothetical protein [Anaerolineae bacterium]MDW8171331.1 hypothetical protein [Anaerolineae bacterium]